MVNSLIGTKVLCSGLFARGFDPRVGFPLIHCFVKALTFIDLDRFVTIFIVSSRVAVQDSPQSIVTVTCRFGVRSIGLFVYSLSLDLVCVRWDEPRGLSLSS